MRFFISIFIGCFLFVVCSAQPKVERIGSVLSEAAEEGFSGNVLVSEKGKIIYAKSFGYANLKEKTPLTSDSIFLVGSVAKTVTAVAIMKLRDQGVLNLDDPLGKYLPDLEYKNLSLRHLLAHTSGIPEYQSPEIIREIEGKGVNNAQMADLFARLKPKLNSEPGSRWEYSNTNYLILALVVEKASGKNFVRFVNESIFVPSGMKRSFVLRQNVPVAFEKDIAVGYRLVSPLASEPVAVPEIEGARRAYATKTNLYGAGNLYSTAGDLLKFHTALQRGRILNGRSLQEMYLPVELSQGSEYSPFAQTNYSSKDALGWFVADDKSKGNIAYHPGGDIGYVSYFLRNVTKDQSVIVLSNVELFRHRTPTALMRIVNDQPFDLDPRSVARKMGRAYISAGLSAMLNVSRN